MRQTFSICAENSDFVNILTSKAKKIFIMPKYTDYFHEAIVIIYCVSLPVAPG